MPILVALLVSLIPFLLPLSPPAFADVVKKRASAATKVIRTARKLRPWKPFPIDFNSAVFGAFVFAIPTIVYHQITKARKKPPLILNPDKVSKATIIGNLTETTFFCRCWQSSSFPYCDGTHNKYNEATGDQLGPVGIVKV